MRKVQELAGGCLLAVCVAALGTAFIAREAWQLLRPGGPRAVDAAPDESLSEKGRQAHSLVTRFTE
jgi:hypothetical protein